MARLSWRDEARGDVYVCRFALSELADEFGPSAERFNIGPTVSGLARPVIGILGTLSWRCTRGISSAPWGTSPNNREAGQAQGQREGARR